jgi:hypothetical protein
MLRDILLRFLVTRTMMLVVMLIGFYHGIGGKRTGLTQSSTLFSGKERGIIYSVQLASFLVSIVGLKQLM